MNYPSDFPSCSELNYSVSSRRFFSFFPAVKWKLPACRSTSQLLSVRLSLNCLSSVCLWLSVCQLSGLANCQMMHWGDRKRCSLFRELICCCFVPLQSRDVSYYSRKNRTASTNGEKDAIHGCSTTQLPQSTKTGMAGAQYYKRTNAHTRHTHKRGTSKWMPLVHEYPIA